MKYINLNQNFNPFNASGPSVVVTKSSQGEYSSKIPWLEAGERYMVTTRCNCADDFMELISCLSAVIASNAKASVFLPYLPLGREFKEVATNSSVGMEDILLILSMYTDDIRVYDVHNEEAFEDFIGGGVNYGITSFVEACIAELGCSDVQLLAPSLDTKWKVREVADTLGVMSSYGNMGIPGEVVVIVVDICDDDEDIISLAKACKMAITEKVYLCVSHGIFSKGLDIFKGTIDGIFTTDSIGELYDDYEDGISYRKWKVCGDTKYPIDCKIPVGLEFTQIKLNELL